MSRNNFTIVITAPSGAGKTTIIHRALEEMEDIEFSVSATTRAARKGERDGIDYYFISQEEFCRQIGEDEFAEWAEVHGNLYGTQKKELDRIQNMGKIPLLDIDVQGCLSLKDKMGDSAVYIFILPPSMNVLEERLRKRGTDSCEQIELRLKTAVSEIAQYAISDYIIINEDLSEAVSAFGSIINAELHRTRRMATLANKISEVKNDNSAG